MKNVKRYFGTVGSGKDFWVKNNLKYGDLIETVSYGVLSFDAICDEYIESGPYIIYFNEIDAIYRKRGFDYCCIWNRFG